MAELAPGLSPYRFGYNSPLTYADPWGLLENPGFTDQVFGIIAMIWEKTPEGGDHSYGVSWNAMGGEEAYRESVGSNQVDVYYYGAWTVDDKGEYKGGSSDQSGGIPNNGVDVSTFTGALAVGELFRQGRGFVDFGMSAERAESVLKNGKFLHNGTAYKNGYYGNQYVNKATVSSSKQIFNSTATFTRNIGKGFTVLNVALAGTQFITSDRSGADWARLGGAAIITGSAFIPVIGPALSIGLGIADSYGAFNSIYNSFD